MRATRVRRRNDARMLVLAREQPMRVCVLKGWRGQVLSGAGGAGIQFCADQGCRVSSTNKSRLISYKLQRIVGVMMDML